MPFGELLQRHAEPLSLPRTAEDPDFDPRNIFRLYESYLAEAQRLYRAGELQASAVYGSMAAHLALRPHPGFFAAPRLERLLMGIAEQTHARSSYLRILDPKRKLRSILHVATELTEVGGLTNMLGRWIATDTSRLHSIALTQHRGPLHGSVEGAVVRSGGKVMRLNREAGGQIEWARRLLNVARGYDAVVLHTYGQDVIPFLAFAESRRRPPVLMLNHADHLFWLGVGISDVVINLRDAAQDLSIARRGVAEERNIVVPTLIESPLRSRSREQAKHELGLPPDCVLMFSAARPMKYRTVNGRTFADSHVEALKRHPKAYLIVLGAGDPPDWRAATEAVGGRIRPLPPNPDSRRYFEAADIYVDSFPFVSSTSMMEAASLGAPLVSRFYGADEARIFATNHPGLDPVTMHCSSEAEYTAALDALLRDPDLRARAGKEAYKSVLRNHVGKAWLQHVEKAYALATALPPIDSTAHLARMPAERFYDGEPDRSLYEIFGYHVEEPTKAIRHYLGLLPHSHRVALWRELHQAGVFCGPRDAIRGLVPDWIVRTAKDR